jgi:hypothetical protein
MDEQERGIGIGWEEREYWFGKGSGADEWTFKMDFVAYTSSRSAQLSSFIPQNKNNQPTNSNTKPQTLMHQNSNPLLSPKIHQFLFLKTLPPAPVAAAGAGLAAAGIFF